MVGDFVMSCGFSDYGSCGGAYRRRGYAYSCSDGSDTYITCGGEVHYGGRYPANYFGSCGNRSSGGYESCGGAHEDYSTGCGSNSCGG